MHTIPNKVFHLEFYDINWLGKSKDRWRFELVSKNKENEIKYCKFALNTEEEGLRWYDKLKQTILSSKSSPETSFIEETKKIEKSP